MSAVRPHRRIVGINFDHMHMGDLLRMAHEHPDAEIVGLCDEAPERMEAATREFGVAAEQCFTDYRRCMENARPDLVILCPATAAHAAWTERIAPYGVWILMEKPFASSLAEADRMVAATRAGGSTLAINWPLRWHACHVTAKRLLDEGTIGALHEVHYYDGNRGPLHHLADKAETPPEFVAREKSRSWFYRREAGGGSLQDYLGYGTTLATWFMNGAIPSAVMAMTDEPPGLEVDEQSVTIARYPTGLSTFHTRWGTYTDPWTHQPQPKCGFVLKGSAGTISSYDYEGRVCLQDANSPEGREIPVDELAPPYQNPVQYLLHCMDSGAPVEGPLDPAIARIGQAIVDAAATSARDRREVSLSIEPAR